MAASHSPFPTLAADEAERLATLVNRTDELVTQGAFIAKVMTTNDQALATLYTTLQFIADIIRHATLKDLARNNFRLHILRGRDPTADEMSNVEQMTASPRFAILDSLYTDFRPLVVAFVKRLVSAGPDATEAAKESNARVFVEVSKQFRSRQPADDSQMAQSFEQTVRAIGSLAQRLLTFGRLPTIYDFILNNVQLNAPMQDYSVLVAKYGMGDDAEEVDRLWMAMHSAIKGLVRIGRPREGGGRRRQRLTKSKRLAKRRKPKHLTRRNQ
jgi:hypothetical protein